MESTFQWVKTAIYGRYEWIQKSADELELPQFTNGNPMLFTIQALTLGLNRIFFRKSGNNFAFGIQGSVFKADKTLDYLYGQYPLSAEIYLRIFPNLMHIHPLRH